jgi:hypothetical protein
VFAESPQDAVNVYSELQRLYRIGTERRGVGAQCLARTVRQSVEFNDAARYVSIDGEPYRAWINGLRSKDSNAQRLSIRATLFCECEPAFGDRGTIHASILVRMRSGSFRAPNY